MKCENEKLQKLFEDFYSYSVFKGNTPQTLAWFKNALNYYCKFLKTRESGLNLEAFIETKNIYDFFSWGVEIRNWKRTSLLCYYKPLKLFCTWLDKNKYIAENPFWKIPQPKVAKSLPTFLNTDEAKILLEGIDKLDFFYKYTNARNRAVIYSFLFLGIRKSELLHLKIKDINFKTKIIKIINGKGMKDRFLPITERLLKVLLEFKKERERLGRSNEYFFSSTFKDVPMTQHALTLLFRRINSDIPLPRHISCHTLRHSFATMMIKGNCEILNLSKMLGHSSVVMTQRYTHLEIGDLQEEIKKHPLEFPIATLSQ